MACMTAPMAIPCCVISVSACICAVPVPTEDKCNNMALQCGHSDCKTGWVYSVEHSY